MITRLIRGCARAAAVAALGAMAGAISTVIAFTRHSAITLDMDRDLPRIVSGLYPPERDRDLTFAWTSGQTEVRLPGLDRRTPWHCSVVYRGGRAQPPQPIVTLSIDGIALASRTATNAYDTLEVTAPERDKPGLTFTIAASPTVVPGPQDRRELGVQIDRLVCRPDPGAAALPPRRAIVRAMLASAAFGAAFGVIGITAGTAIGAILLLAAAQSWPLSIPPAPYGPYIDAVPRLAIWIALAMVVVIRALEWWKGERMRQTARFVVAFTAAALYLKLLALLHPAKPLIDAVFQAHRLEWVLGGRYFFTQPMPGGVQFPYAIGLYVFAAPWSLVTRDYVSLLRIVVCATEACAGALLYLMIVRTRGDRLAGAMAAALFTVVPLAYWFVGNANLTNAFGQSIALVAVAAVTLLPLGPRQPLQIAVAAAVCAFAFLSHISTFAILVVTLVSIAALYWLLGGPALRGPAMRILAATVVAIVVSVASYYGYFGDVYKRALQVRAAAPAAATGTAASEPTAKAAGPLHRRTLDALNLTREAIGWPILALACIGALRLWRGHTRDRLALVVLAWIAAYVVFLGVGLMRVDPQYQRYSFEFVGRVAFATYPAAVILAAHGAAWAWRAGWGPRVASAALMLLAVIGGVQRWIGWLQ